MQKKKTDQIFHRFEKITALVIGDAMIDSYLWGKVERVSPEAPIPIVSVIKKENRLGGAGNVALNLQALGATPILFAVTGGGEKGGRFRKLMEKTNLPTVGIFTDPGRKTTVKSRIICNGQHVVRIDEESTDFINPELEEQIFDSITLIISQKKIDVIIFADYDKGMITPSLFEKVLSLAKENRVFVAVDPKRRNFGIYHDVDLFKPNFREFTEGTGHYITKGDLDHLKVAAEEFKKKKGFQLIFITLSELGVFISNGVEQTYFPAEIRNIADVSGAGDTVISVASLCLASGLSPEMTAHISNLAGGLVCEQVGVIPVGQERLRKEMEKAQP